MTDKLKQTFLGKKIDQAVKKRQQLSGYSMNITKKLKQGSISQTEAQYQRKVIEDTRKVLTDYINFQKTKLKNIRGYRLKRKTKRGGKIMFFNDPKQMLKKLEIIMGSIVAGNNSKELRNTGVALLDILLRNSILNKPQYNKIYKNYFNLN